LLLLRERLHWQGDTSYQRQNVSRQGKTQAQLPRETVALINQANQQDIALYHYARSLFQAQCREQGPLFPLRARYFTLQNRYRPMLAAARTFSVRAKLREIW
jgi:hypothetical protein